MSIFSPTGNVELDRRVMAAGDVDLPVKASYIVEIAKQYSEAEFESVFESWRRWKRLHTAIEVANLLALLVPLLVFAVFVRPSPETGQIVGLGWFSLMALVYLLLTPLKRRIYQGPRLVLVAGDSPTTARWLAHEIIAVRGSGSQWTLWSPTLLPRLIKLLEAGVATSCSQADLAALDDLAGTLEEYPSDKGESNEDIAHLRALLDRFVRG